MAITPEQAAAMLEWFKETPLQESHASQIEGWVARALEKTQGPLGQKLAEIVGELTQAAANFDDEKAT